jgi:hypothetical protein
MKLEIEVNVADVRIPTMPPTTPHSRNTCAERPF